MRGFYVKESGQRQTMRMSAGRAEEGNAACQDFMGMDVFWAVRRWVSMDLANVSAMAVSSKRI